MYTARGFRNIFIITVILLSYSMLSAQVRIKERVEISPTQNAKLPATIRADFQDITIPPIDPMVTALGPGGGFIYGVDCADPDADEVFVPRIGGTMSIALCDCDGSATGDLHSEVLLVFGPDGRIKNTFPLSDLDSNMAKSSNGSFHIWDPCRGYWFDLQTNNNSIIWFNPWAFNEAAYEKAKQLYGHADSANYWYAPYKMKVDVKSWEPIRFRLYSPTTGNIYKALNCFYKAMPNGFSPGNWTQLPDVLVFRTADWDTIFNVDYSTVFPMIYSTDSSKVGGGPSSVQCYDPYFFAPDSGFYRVIIGNVLPNVTGTLSVIDTMPHILVTDIRSHQGDTILIGPYSEGTLLRFDLDGMCQSGGQDYYASGGVSFESWTDYDFQDAAIWFEYAAQPIDHLELWSTTSTIYYGDTVDIEIVPCGADSLFSPLGTDYNYEFSIELTGETSRYVELIYEEESSDRFEHVSSYNRRGADIRLAANKEEPDSVVALTFHLKAKYIGQGGAASSMGRIPVEAARTGVMMKQAIDSNNKSTVDYKDGKITINIGTQKKTFEKIGIKKLQSLYSAKTRRIGRPVITGERKTIPAVSLSKKKILASTMEGDDENVLLENDWALGINPPQEILLGQTIYFQAVEYPIQTPEHQKKLLIIPLEKVNERHNPKLSGVKFTVEKREGDKLGVYYDEKKDEHGKDLDSDIIRLVGRYWKTDLKYSVVLNATTSDRNGHMLVEVKKPAKLHDSTVFSKPYRMTKNIRNEDLDIDELCILYGDSIGISPQVIKGQMFQESYHKDDHFDPSYRYEPWKDRYFADPDQNDYWKAYKEQPFWITGEQLHPMGLGKEVPVQGAHQNVMPIYYPQEPTLQGIYAVQNWNEYWSAQKDSVIGSKKLTKKWREDFLSYFKQLLIFPQGADVILMSRSMAMSSVQTYILRTYTDYAQTRKCASYGLIQMLYTTAQDQGYNKGVSIESCSTPEELNDELIEMPLYKKFTEKNLKLQFGSINANVPEGNWPKGWEQTWIDSFKKYNRSKDYGASVFKHSRKFYPQSNKGAI